MCYNTFRQYERSDGTLFPQTTLKHIVTGIIAPVDSDKTTLTEALLYKAGELKKLGRVDNGDAFLDFEELERKRGITIFSHQANLTWKNLRLTLLDTPGHVDFVSQTEQVLRVLDCAIMVVSARDLITSHARTLWNLLDFYHVPTFVFVNKLDLSELSKADIVQRLKQLDQGIVPFDGTETEELAELDDALLEKYLENDSIDRTDVLALIRQRKAFPCFFGSALKLEGIDALLHGLADFAPELESRNEFGARVFKISHTEKKERLTWLRVFGGSLHPKDTILDDQKANELRVYDAKRYGAAKEIVAGQICAIPNLNETFVGQGLGFLENDASSCMTPVLSYALNPNGCDLHACLVALKELEDEDEHLHVVWSKQLNELRVQLMGPIQLEVLQQILKDRYELDVSFEQGRTLYKETITQTIEGVGHFEPLRHYAEAHLIMEPGKPGSGLVFSSDCSLEELDKNWQNQILSCLKSKEHIGVLIGAPLTDVKITLATGRASIKHTVGGDFRQASGRAVRQGLMMLKERQGLKLLEPWYRFVLKVPEEKLGRAMNDIQQMSGTFSLDQATGTLSGLAPVSEMQSYAETVRTYTRGKGLLELSVDGYRQCHNEQEVVSNSSYDPLSDLENTPQSVFCAHGAGYTVDWSDVPKMAHEEYVLKG